MYVCNVEVVLGHLKTLDYIPLGSSAINGVHIIETHPLLSLVE